tara:strand:+ start:5019 stop:6134 length:1116 start_codon:yes stop_codon:yes gene_type:complete
MPQATPSGGANSERIENDTFPRVRSDLNDNFEALQTLNSGDGAPTTTAAFMPWLKTETGQPSILYIRNSADSDWIEVGSLSTSSFAPKGLTDIANGGTGQTTAAAAIAALLPSQANNAGKTLSTDGSILSWVQLVSSSYQTFTSSGTWNKPSTGTFVIILAWGGGGGGSKNYVSLGGGGGGGGACALYIAPLSSLGSSYTVTVGGGGAGGSGSYYASGAAGGDSSVSGLVTAYGGAGGVTAGAGDSVGGHGGGYWGVGSANLGGSASYRYGVEGDDSFSHWVYVAGTPQYFGGGGGGAADNATSRDGNKSFFGGGGGASRHGTGGSSIVGGDGGNGGDTGSNGSAPAGGGGGGRGGNGGSGAAGRVDIYVV